MSDRAATATTPKAMYLVAVVFFFQALLAALGVVSLIVLTFAKRSPEVVAVTVGLTVITASVGAYLLVREYRFARWLMYAMTAYFAVMLVLPANPRPPLYESAATQYRNRALIVLPMIASCIYLARKR